jgi:hypothetical protein
MDGGVMAENMEEKLRELMEQSSKAEAAEAIIKALMSNQPPTNEWWQDGDVMGIDLMQGANSHDKDTAIAMLARAIVAKGRSVSAVQHGENNGVWRLNVRHVA